MGNYTVAGTFGSHLAECWSFLHICTVDVKNRDENSFLWHPILKKGITELFAGHDLLSKGKEEKKKKKNVNC